MDNKSFIMWTWSDETLCGCRQMLKRVKLVGSELSSQAFTLNDR